MTKRIRILDADADVRTLLCNALTSEGYEVKCYATGGEAEIELMNDAGDLLLIDIDLPGFEAFSLIRDVCERFDTAIIIVSGRSALEDRIIGLDVGADDYVVKPFEVREMLARIRSLLRRRGRCADVSIPAQPDTWVRFGDWSLNPLTRAVRDHAGHDIALTTMEYRLLETLMRNTGTVLNRTRLREALYADDTTATDRSIDVGIMRLRKKLYDDVEAPRIIKTVRNTGYVFVAPMQVKPPETASEKPRL